MNGWSPSAAWVSEPHTPTTVLCTSSSPGDGAGTCSTVMSSIDVTRTWRILAVMSAITRPFCIGGESGRSQLRGTQTGLDLDLAAEAALEAADALSIGVEREAVADENLRVEHAREEELGSPFVTVQDCHGTRDRNLVIVDLVGLDGGPGGVAGDTALKVGAALPDPAEAVLDRPGITGCVDDDVPAAGAVELVR